jgi:hypothetical protein
VLWRGTPHVFERPERRPVDQAARPPARSVVFHRSRRPSPKEARGADRDTLGVCVLHRVQQPGGGHQDRAGNAVTIGRDAQGTVATVTGPSGRTLTLTWVGTAPSIRMSPVTDSAVARCATSTTLSERLVERPASNRRPCALGRVARRRPEATAVLPVPVSRTSWTTSTHPPPSYRSRSSTVPCWAEARPGRAHETFPTASDSTDASWRAAEWLPADAATQTARLMAWRPPVHVRGPETPAWRPPFVRLY